MREPIRRHTFTYGRLPPPSEFPRGWWIANGSKILDGAGNVVALKVSGAWQQQPMKRQPHTRKDNR